MASPTLSIQQHLFLYSGAITDNESQLQYLNARYYNSDLTRFISRDSVDLSNRFTYADGNPTMYEDPSGHMIFPALLAPVGDFIGQDGTGFAGTTILPKLEAVVVNAIAPEIREIDMVAPMPVIVPKAVAQEVPVIMPQKDDIDSVADAVRQGWRMRFAQNQDGGVSVFSEDGASHYIWLKCTNEGDMQKLEKLKAAMKASGWPQEKIDELDHLFYQRNNYKYGDPKKNRPASAYRKSEYHQDNKPRDRDNKGPSGRQNPYTTPSPYQNQPNPKPPPKN